MNNFSSDQVDDHGINVPWFELDTYQQLKSRPLLRESRFLHREVLVSTLHYNVPTFPYSHFTSKIVDDYLPLTGIIPTGIVCVLYELTESSIFCVRNLAGRATGHETARELIYHTPNSHTLRTGEVVVSDFSHTDTDYLILILVSVANLAQTMEVTVSVTLPVVDNDPLVITTNTLQKSFLDFNIVQVLYSHSCA